MPRANRYLREGYTFHLTHRCHNQKFLLQRQKDKDAYRMWLFRAVQRHSVPIYAYCITSNHVHMIVHAADTEKVGQMMHLAAGATARAYNRSGERSGAFWEDQYHCTIIQSGAHLRRCIRYVHMNMVRAGVVQHPREWKWCGHDELLGLRERYRILSIDHLLDHLGGESPDVFRQWYSSTTDECVASENQKREPYWTESLAVGSRAFISSVQDEYQHRAQYDIRESEDGNTWTIKEDASSYSAPDTPSQPF